MLIVCPNCATSYMIDRATLGAAGRAVRCARCKTTWQADGLAGVPRPVTGAGAQVDDLVAVAVAVAVAVGTRGASQAPPTTDSAVDKPPVLEPEPTPVQPAIKADQPVGMVEELALRVESAAAPGPEKDTATASAEAPAEQPMPVAESPPLVPPVETAPLPESAPAELEAEEIESFAARRERLRARRTRSYRSSRWTALILVLFAFNVAVIGARNEVVRYLPQTASLFSAIGLPVNLRQLKFENVRIAKDNSNSNSNNSSVLTIEGTIASTASEPVNVPRLRFAARNAAGQEIYSWTAAPSRSTLQPGEKLDFHSRLAAPPPDATSVMVRFFSREDASAGEK